MGKINWNPFRQKRIEGKSEAEMAPPPDKKAYGFSRKDVDIFMSEGGNLASNLKLGQSNRKIEAPSMQLRPVDTISSQYDPSQLAKFAEMFKRRKEEILSRRLQPGREQTIVAGKK